MLTANVSPTCSPCGHVMQPVGPRTLWERQIGGQAASFWPGTEYECVCCRTRVVLVNEAPIVAGSVGHEALSALVERVATIPAQRIVGAEHLPWSVRQDSRRLGGTMPLSQRQQAARIVEDYFSRDDAGPIDALIALADLFDLDIAALTGQKAEAIVATVADPSLHTWDGPVPAAIRDAEGAPVVQFPSLSEVD